MNRRYENQQQPERYPQQEWSDDDYRGGNRYRVNQPYASAEDLQESPRGGRLQSNARQGYGDYESERDLSGAQRGSYYGGAHNRGPRNYGTQQDYGSQSAYQSGASQGGYDADEPGYGGQRGGWNGPSQLGGYPGSSNYGQGGSSTMGGNYGGRGQRNFGSEYGSGSPAWRSGHAQPGGRYDADYSASGGGYVDHGQRGAGSNFGQSRSDFNQQGGYGSGYSQVGNPSQSPQRGFSGRGPKGYARSDDRLKEDISERLTDDFAIDASDISVEVRNGTVTLSGTVDERWMKHHIEDLVDRCSGVQDIENKLTVSRARNASPSASTGATSSASTTTAGSTRKQ